MPPEIIAAVFAGIAQLKTLCSDLCTALKVELDRRHDVEFVLSSIISVYIILTGTGRIFLQAFILAFLSTPLVPEFQELVFQTMLHVTTIMAWTPVLVARVLFHITFYVSWILLSLLNLFVSAGDFYIECADTLDAFLITEDVGCAIYNLVMGIYAALFCYAYFIVVRYLKATYWVKVRLFMIQTYEHTIQYVVTTKQNAVDYVVKTKQTATRYGLETKQEIQDLISNQIEAFQLRWRAFFDGMNRPEPVSFSVNSMGKALSTDTSEEGTDPLYIITGLGGSRRSQQRRSSTRSQQPKSTEREGRPSSTRSQRQPSSTSSQQLRSAINQQQPSSTQN